jgi:GntR family transcriptional regulator/MocR family aminotransferase
MFSILMDPILLQPKIAQCFSRSSFTGKETLYRWVFRSLELAIRKGELEAGFKLPPTRLLAEALGIARNTVKTAYEMLLSEGYIESRVGDGSYVAELPQDLIRPSNKNKKVGADLPLSEYAQQYISLAPLNSDVRKALQPGIPALTEFPMGYWKRCLSFASSYKALESFPPAGDLKLREGIVDYLLKFRGIEADPEQVLITSGSQQAAFLTAQLLLNKGEKVIVETPGFPGTSGVFSSLGCHIEALNMEEDVTIASNARLINLTPSRNFPLGHTLSLSQRLKAVQWAEQNNSWVLEDDYDSEFAEGHPVSALLSICESDRVIYTGTFSRSMFPALRLGYMVLPPKLVNVFTRARRYMDGGLSQVVQVAMAEFMGQGYYARHLKKMRKFYGEREKLIHNLIRSTRLNELAILSAPGGMHLVIELPDNIEDQCLVRSLNKEGLGVRALSGYTQLGSRLNGLVIGYCADSEVELEAGIRLIDSRYNQFKYLIS